MEMHLKQEAYEVVGICIDVHRTLGHGFLKIVYKDAIEYEFKSRKINYTRDKEYPVEYKNVVRPHRFFADFVVYGSIILEIKAAEGGLTNHFIAMLINYLKVSGCKLGLLINFGRKSLEYKRFVF